jgi:hypothetical protein
MGRGVDAGGELAGRWVGFTGFVHCYDRGEEKGCGEGWNREDSCQEWNCCFEEERGFDEDGFSDG